jgi:DNA-binding NarL/FixJ family response regulator
MQSMQAPPSSDTRTGLDPIRLVLLDDHTLVRQSLARFFVSEPGFEIVGERATAPEALELIQSSAVDLVLLEFDLAAENGIEFISTARRAGYQGNFLIVTGVIDAKRSAAALRRRASGIFLKSKSPDLLLHVIRLVMSGEVWVDQKIIQLLVDQARKSGATVVSPLTERQQSVLQGLIEGFTSKQISRRVGLSESTVKATLQQLFHKAGVRTRSQLVRVALEGSLTIDRKVRQESDVDAKPLLRTRSNS